MNVWVAERRHMRTCSTLIFYSLERWTHGRRHRRLVRCRP